MLRRNRERLTQSLSGSAYALTIPGGKSVLPWILLALFASLCATAYLLIHTQPPALQAYAEVERLQQEVGRLQHDLKLGEMRLQQEVVTREELARQMDAQSQKLKQSEQELQFFRGQKDKFARDKTLRN
jgi:hypothetical protein